ncbi:MAG: hypothetical protein ACOCVA_04870 [Prolixibacteraceae bacterium]
MWQKYFKLVGLVPGKVITQTHGTIDFAGNVPVETCKELFEQDFRYLELTDEGKEKLYGIAPSGLKTISPKGEEKEKKKSYSASNKTRKRRSSQRIYKRNSTKPDT